MTAENSPSRRWQQMHKISPIYTPEGVILARQYPGLAQTHLKMQALDNDWEASERAKNIEKNILQRDREAIEEIKSRAKEPFNQASSEVEPILEPSMSPK